MMESYVADSKALSNHEEITNGLLELIWDVVTDPQTSEITKARQRAVLKKAIDIVDAYYQQKG